MASLNLTSFDKKKTFNRDLFDGLVSFQLFVDSKTEKQGKSWWMNVLKRSASEIRCTIPRTLWKMVEGSSGSFCSVKEFILEQENRNTAQNIEQYVRLFERFLKTKDDSQKIEAISSSELNECINHFIMSVRTKHGTEYQPTSPWSLITNLKRHL